MSWMDFSDAEQQTGDIIPDKTMVKVVMKIRPGGYNDPSKGWTGGFATQGSTGAIYLDAEFTVMGGRHNKRKIWTLIGLHSPKSNKWEAMGRSFLRAALESARGVSPSDASPAAAAARQIAGFHELDGLQFAAFVSVEKAQPGSQYGDKNVIQTVIPATHRDYADIMSGAGTTTTPSAAASALGQASAAAASKPAWAT